MTEFTEAELIAFIDEALPADRSSELEGRLRDDAALRQRLVEMTQREITGVHSVAAIWRRRRLSCPDRETWGMFLIGAIDDDQAAWMRSHLEDVGCRYCEANVDDLRASRESDATERRRRYFQTSAGHLK